MKGRRTLYLIRHGQTEWNLKRRLQGGKDSPLTALGRSQAEAAAASLKERPPSRILSSTLGRARTTADIIAKASGVDVEADERLGEVRFGDAEGLTVEEIDRHWPDLRERRERDKWHVRWPNGESYEDADARLSSYCRDVLGSDLTTEDRAPLAIVGHETINMILTGRLLDLDPSTVTRLGQPNHVIYRIEGGLVDHAHLGDDRLEWIPGMLQKRSDEILHIAA
ncbi:MAG: histidine phosphatase family protein [Pseudomonadota bacterium]